MGHLLKLMEDLIAMFHSYSEKEGDKFKLSKSELKNLLQEEFSVYSGCNDSAEVDKIMNELDENKDGQVDFQEFIVLVAAMTVACNECFVEGQKSSKKAVEGDQCSKKD